MTDESFERCLKIMQSHVDFLEEHKEDGVFSKEENEKMIEDYKEGIQEGYKLLNR